MISRLRYGLWSWLADLLLCPWCLSVWVGCLLACAWMYLPVNTLILGLAVSRAANVGNDLMGARSRTPRAVPPQQEDVV